MRGVIISSFFVRPAGSKFDWINTGESLNECDNYNHNRYDDDTNICISYSYGYHRNFQSIESGGIVVFDDESNVTIVSKLN